VQEGKRGGGLRAEFTLSEVERVARCLFYAASLPFFLTSSDGALDPTAATLRIESRFRRITVSRSGSNSQKHRVE
jgi:hypothetical protein